MPVRDVCALVLLEADGSAEDLAMCRFSGSTGMPGIVQALTLALPNR